MRDVSRGLACKVAGYGAGGQRAHAVAGASGPCRPGDLCYIRLSGDRGAGWFLGVMEPGGSAVTVALTGDSKAVEGRQVRRAQVTSVTTYLPVFIADGKLTGVGAEAELRGYLAIKESPGKWPEPRE